MLTAGIDLAAQPTNTAGVVVDWSTDPPKVERATRKVTDEQILGLCTEVAGQRGRVGIDCALGWPRPFVAFVAAHAVDRALPTMDADTRSLRLRATDIAVHSRLGLTPLSVSTNLLGVTAFRAARMLAELQERGMPVDRAGRGLVCEVYPRASREAWSLNTEERDLHELLDRLPLCVDATERSCLGDEHVFDALIAALTARAVALGVTDSFPEDQEDLAAEEGWIHVPPRGHDISRLGAQ